MSVTEIEKKQKLKQKQKNKNSATIRPSLAIFKV